jgi:hypothetical protein
LKINLTRSYENCGWTPPRRRGELPYCGRRRREILPSDQCPCRNWVHRLRIDRLRKGRKG